MRERIARALCAVNGVDPESRLYDDIEKTGLGKWQAFIDEAKDGA